MQLEMIKEAPNGPHQASGSSVVWLTSSRAWVLLMSQALSKASRLVAIEFITPISWSHTLQKGLLSVVVLLHSPTARQSRRGEGRCGLGMGWGGGWFKGGGGAKGTDSKGWHHYSEQHTSRHVKQARNTYKI